MPDYMAGLAGCSLPDGRSRHYTTVRPEHYAIYEWNRSVYDMCFPMNALELTGRYDGTHDEVCALVEQSSPHFYTGVCFRNYSGNLDLYIRYADSTNVHYYDLQFHYEVDIGDDRPQYYPQAVDYYLATERRFVRLLSAEEFAAMGAFPGFGLPRAAAPLAEAPAV